MSEAPPGTGDNLEQKILQMLSDAGGPVKTAQLVKTCQVPKKMLNQVLYRLKKEAKVSLEAPATWRLGGGPPGEEVPAVPEDRTAQPSLDERILKFLEANGPHKALHIAKALGMTTAKEVNPQLYAMRNRHLLNYDGQMWTIYGSSLDSQGSAQSGGRQESTAIIYQQSPINVICQQGDNSHISIAEAEAIQIGHGNVILRQEACGDTGPRPPCHLPLPVPDGPSAQGTPPGACGTQHIHMEKSMIRRVQLGHSNEMNLQTDPAEHSTYSFSGSPPATAADARTSFNVQTPEPGSHPEGDTAQRVHIKSCFLEDATIGNSNKMTIYPRSQGPGGVTESGDSDEPREDTGASSEASPSGSCFHTPSNPMLLISELRAASLQDRPQTTEPALREDSVPHTGSCQPQE